MTDYHNLPTILADLNELIEEVRDHRTRSIEGADFTPSDVDLWASIETIAARYGDV